MGPISGLRVVEVGDLGEVAGKLLADAGAEVIKVEPIGGARSRFTGPYAADRFGPNSSLFFAYWNTNKRGVTLDLWDADAAALWRGLIQGADVVIDAVSPGELDDLGLGYDAFADQERLIWCSITPFGTEGPWRDFAVNDLVQVALGGPMMSTGYDDHELPPIRPEGGHSLAMAGEYAVTAILTAIWQREDTGRGQFLDVSIHEAVSCTTEGAFQNWEYHQRISQRQTGRHANPTVPTPEWQLQCADGDYVCLMGAGFPRDERVWSALMAWMDESGANHEIRDLFTSRGARSLEDRQLILTTIHSFVKSQPAEEVYRRGQACHLPWGYVRRPEQNLDDPHWHDRGFFVEGDLPGGDGRVLYPGAPYMFSETPLEFRRRAPLLGEHNFEVYSKEMGVSSEQILALAQREVI
jgi:crotonobetainyl-CoA:carnitine CoA-transferase CaiB-like acyl-CoA transferase